MDDSVNDSPEVIKQQMEQTQASLQTKIEALEQQVTGTVQEAATAVTDTVQTVKDAVENTVETVKGTVQETVSSVAEGLDLSRQVREHPWAMMLGAVAVGYVGGRLLDRALLPSDTAPAAGPYPGAAPLAAHEHRNGAASESGLMSWLGDLATQFGPELNELKGMAVGAVLGIVRDMVTESVPPQLGPQLGDAVDSLTTKLGGKPIHGPVLGEGPTTTLESKGERNEEWNEPKVGRPVGSA